MSQCQGVIHTWLPSTRNLTFSVNAKSYVTSFATAFIVLFTFLSFYHCHFRHVSSSPALLNLHAYQRSLRRAPLGLQLTIIDTLLLGVFIRTTICYLVLYVSHYSFLFLASIPGSPRTDCLTYPQTLSRNYFGRSAQLLNLFTLAPCTDLKPHEGPATWTYHLTPVHWLYADSYKCFRLSDQIVPKAA